MLALQKKIHLLLAERLLLTPARRKTASALVSFTFDDFPRSALNVGGKMLNDQGWHGTYYCSSGLIDKTESSGAMFTRRDLDELLAAEHELGCHTRDHLSSFSQNPRSFAENCAANRDAIKKMLGGHCIRNFSFPNGHATVSVKRKLSSAYDTCRSIAWGINIDPIDLSYLRANPIYSRYGVEPIRKLLAENVERNGWLILYTHDINPNPSSYGCTPNDFAEILRLVSESGSEVVTVGEAVTRFTRV